MKKRLEDMRLGSRARSSKVSRVLHIKNNEWKPGSAEWYRHGYGVVLSILFFPYFIIWYAWSRAQWRKELKLVVTFCASLLIMATLFAAFTSSEPRQSIKTATTPTGSMKLSATQIDDKKPEASNVPSSSSLSQELFTVVKVIDGDTIDIKAGGEIQRVRFIGIDTPEKNDPRKPVECFSKEASDHLSSLLMNKTVRVETDDSQDKRDKYNRYLYYIYVDGENINKRMIADGYAYEYTYRTPYKYQAEFKSAQQSASAAKKGLWAASTCNGTRNKTSASTQTSPKPSSQPSASSAGNCDPNYTPCIPNVSYDLDCGDIKIKVTIVGTDRHRFDRNGDGTGCESYG